MTFTTAHAARRASPLGAWWCRTLGAAAAAIAAFCLAAAPAAAQSYDQIVLLTRSETLEGMTLLAIDEQSIHIRDREDHVRIVPLSECIGLVIPDVRIAPTRNEGVVVLADGQRFPGRLEESAKSSPTQIVWDHQYLRLLRFDLDDIDWIAFNSDAARPTESESDVVILSNGDRIDGFVNEVGSTLKIELEDETEIEIDLDVVLAIRLVNPSHPPAPGHSRIWTRKGSIYDVASVKLGDDQILRISAPSPREGEDEYPQHLSHVAGILFDANAIVPLALLQAHDLEGPMVRYIVSPPSVSSEQAALGLQDVTMQGPLTVRYAQPDDAAQFVAHARLVHETSDWSDCELVIYDDDREVFRARLNRTNPQTTAAIELSGSELTIEITEGAHGPIDDRLILERAMIVRE